MMREQLEAYIKAKEEQMVFFQKAEDSFNKKRNYQEAQRYKTFKHYLGGEIPTLRDILNSEGTSSDQSL